MASNLVFIENQSTQRLLNEAFPFTQTLRFKRICSTEEDFTEQSKALPKRISSNIKHQTSTSNRTSLIIIYNFAPPDIKRAVNKLWDIVKINRDFEQVFTEPPIIALIQNGNLQDILDTKTIASKIKVICQIIDQNGNSKPWNSKLNNLCCTQVQSTNTFKHYTKPSKYTINSFTKANT